MMTTIYRLGKILPIIAFFSMITSCGDFLEESRKTYLSPKQYKIIKSLLLERCSIWASIMASYWLNI